MAHKTSTFGVLVVATLFFVLVTFQGPKAQQGSPRLYVLDGGTLVNPDPSWAGVTVEDIKGFTSLPSPTYLVVHPNGTLLWDTGLGDDLVSRPADETRRGRWGQVVTRSVRSQLAEIGYSPENITYLALSHMHFDHVANANDYANSTWIVQQAEFETIDFDDSDRTTAFSRLKDSETILIEGDHDVFSDGTVIIKSTPGHTPGHQSLFINFTMTAPVVISGDLYHYEAERVLGKMPEREVDPGVTATSRQSLEEFLRETGAQLWIQHEVMVWATLNKSPLYYE